MKYFNYSRRELKEALVEMFLSLDLVERFKIDTVKLVNLIAEIEKNYKRVPYHNFTHAFNIVHMSYYMLKFTKVREYLDDLDTLAVMIGALGHDIDHSGMNNMYY